MNLGLVIKWWRLVKPRWSIQGPHIKDRKLMEVVKQKREKMRHGHINNKDNYGGQVENVLESEKNGGKKTIHYPHICSKQNRATLDFSCPYLSYPIHQQALLTMSQILNINRTHPFYLDKTTLRATYTFPLLQILPLP